jgi:hypothetical protein
VVVDDASVVMMMSIGDAGTDERMDKRGDMIAKSSDPVHSLVFIVTPRSPTVAGTAQRRNPLQLQKNISQGES